MVEFSLLLISEENKLVVIIDFFTLKSIAMKKIIFAMIVLLGSASVFAGTLPTVNEKVLKAFEQTFRDPKDVTWHEFTNYYEVDFNEESIKTQVRYDEDGNIIGTTRYYFEEQLPPFIVSQLKKKYPDRSVYGVTEIYNQTDLTYYITMEDGKNWYSVKSNSMGVLEQTDKFKKAPTH